MTLLSFVCRDGKHSCFFLTALFMMEIFNGVVRTVFNLNMVAYEREPLCQTWLSGLWVGLLEMKLTFHFLSLTFSLSLSLSLFLSSAHYCSLYFHHFSLHCKAHLCLLLHLTFTHTHALTFIHTLTHTHTHIHTHTTTHTHFLRSICRARAITQMFFALP